MKVDTVLRVLGGGLTLIMLGSGFAWAAFNACWWTPIDAGDLRGVALTFFHVGGIIAGITLLIEV